jgi:hypothetical protein
MLRAPLLCGRCAGAHLDRRPTTLGEYRVFREWGGGRGSLFVATRHGDRNVRGASDLASVGVDRDGGVHRTRMDPAPEGTETIVCRSCKQKVPVAERRVRQMVRNGARVIYLQPGRAPRTAA